MGVTFNVKLDPKLAGLDTAGISELRDVTTLSPTAYVQLLREWMVGQAYKPVQRAVYAYACGCMRATPVKTGNARRNWTVTSGSGSGTDEYIDLRDYPVSAEAAEKEMERSLLAQTEDAVGKAEGHSKTARAEIRVSNKTPYIGTLEAKRGMTAYGLADMLAAMSRE